jgi:hypothetical protein
MATRNKLLFLRHTLPRLLANLQENEEVVIIDGASTDGTTEYLQQLHTVGKIDQFLSEPDHGEAHALNKGLLMARGELIKFISDDDVFHYPTIACCKQFMLKNPAADILGCDGGEIRWGQTEPSRLSNAIQGYEKWEQEGRPFTFSGLGMMLRKKSLSLLGMLHTGVVNVDDEYSRRVGTLPVKMAWCTRLGFIRFLTRASNSHVHGKRIAAESQRVQAFYNCQDPQPLALRLRNGVPEPIRRALRPVKRILRGTPPDLNLSAAPISEESAGKVIQQMSAWLHQRNETLPCSFRMAARGSP